MKTINFFMLFISTLYYSQNFGGLQSLQSKQYNTGDMYLEMNEQLIRQKTQNDYYKKQNEEINNSNYILLRKKLNEFSTFFTNIKNILLERNIPLNDIDNAMTDLTTKLNEIEMNLIIYKSSLNDIDVMQKFKNDLTTLNNMIKESTTTGKLIQLVKK